MNFVYFVYHHCLGSSNSLFIYSVCSSESKAKIARAKVVGFKLHKQYFTENPACTPYASRIHVLKVAVDVVYSLGVLSQVNRRDLEGLEVIS